MNKTKKDSYFEGWAFWNWIELLFWTILEFTVVGSIWWILVKVAQ